MLSSNPKHYGAEPEEPPTCDQGHELQKDSGGFYCQDCQNELEDIKGEFDGINGSIDELLKYWQIKDYDKELLKFVKKLVNGVKYE